MGDLKTAVRKLLQDDRTILPDALEVLKSSPDPIQLVDLVLQSSPTGTQVSRQTLMRSMQQSRQTQASFLTPPPKQKSTNHTSRRSRLMSSLIQSNATTPEPVSKQGASISNNSVIGTSLEDLTGLSNYESDLEIIRNPQLSTNLAGDINDMVGYFQDRFKKLYRLFRRRGDLSNLTKIKDIKQNHPDITVVGMITDKLLHSESSGRIILEDPNSEQSLHAIIANNEPLVEEAQQIMNDSVICIRGTVQNFTFYIQEFILPDVPYTRNRVTADLPVHVAFLSDIHVGSKGFLTKPMERFIAFLKGEYGNRKMQLLGQQTKYVLFSGDVVDGVGIYPNQQDDLAIDSIQDQYNEFARFVDQIPEDVEIVVIPGNHDMVRSAEPQPIISPEYAPDLSGLSNVHMLPNPSQIAIHGVQTLMYHCTSLPDIMNHIPGLPIEKPVDIMVHMLKARHLAPIWGEKTPIATEPEDHLVIDPLPDIFHGGHVHINGLGGYRGVQIVNSGTMQAQTSYQKSLNIDPTPGLVPLINLQTRKPSLLDLMTS